MRSLRTFGLLLSFTLFLNLTANAAVPTTAKGMWIWQIQNEENGNLDSIISRLKSAGVTWVAVKLGDSNSLWDRSGEHLYNWASSYGGFDSVIAKFHENGIKVYGWQYVYGSSQYTGTGAATEADVTNQILDIPGVDGFIIDAEVQFEASGMTAAAAQYLADIRAAHPNSFIALTSFARVTGQPMPWTTFLSSCDANMPQAYWALRPTTISQEFSAMRNDFESWEQIWINDGYLSAIKPIVPIGCENDQLNPHKYQMQYGDIQQFSSLCQNAGYVGVSLWDYDGMDTMNWSDYAASWVNTPPTTPHVSVLMPTATENVPTYDTIKVDLNTPMDPASMNAAFSISPPVNGKLIMNPDLNQWTFAPDTFLTWSTQYTVTVDSSAASVLGVHLTAPYSFKFTTVPVDSTPPMPLAVSPQNGGTSVAHTYFEFIMNKPINYSSFVAHLSFVDSTGKKISLAKDLSQVTSNNLMLMAFRSALALTPGMKYTASIGPGVTDYYGNQTKTTYSTTFTVDTAEASRGSIVESFESPSNLWMVAPVGQGTIGVDTASTSFSFETSKKYDGNYAGGLQYAFDTTNANAICEVENTQGLDISGSSSVGMWVFGDNSGNELDYVFGSTKEKFVPVDTINWYGWKFIGMWRAGSDTSTSTFKGLAVRRLQSALLAGGSLYVDDIQVNGKVTGIQGRVVQPVSFELFQNYPNPFNPSTKIDYSLKENGRVSIRVYDVLGREVATLVNGVESAGQHSVTFNAGNLSSGVYIYSLTTSDGMKITKKMILIK